MRILLVFLLNITLLSQYTYCQIRAISKIYLFNFTRSLEPAPSAVQIRASGRVGHTLIETDMDSLGFVSPGGQTVYLLVEPGKTYYYGHGIGSFMCQEMSANAFWLSVAAESRTYRHYSITKQAGVIEVREDKH
jgi:hypothetical protein